MSRLPPEKLQPAARLDAYLFVPRGLDWATFLAPFHPPLPRAGDVLFASFFCDAFVEDQDGAVWWVNGLEERVDRVAINRDKAIERINNEHLVMLKTKLMEQLIIGDMLLPPGMMYGLITPRTDGGKYHPDNIGTATIADSFAYIGERFRVKNAPPPQPATAADAAPAKSKSPFWGKKK